MLNTKKIFVEMHEFHSLLKNKALLDFKTVVLSYKIEQDWLNKLQSAFELYIDEIAENEKENAAILIEKTSGIADIIANTIYLGPQALSAFLLSGLYKKQLITKDFIIKNFSETTFRIVDSLCKVSLLHTEKAYLQPDNFRKFLLSVADDVRVVLVKIAEKLYEMRRLSLLDDDTRLKHVIESNYLYAPLAHRLGLYNIKSEFEDLALAYTHTIEYNDIVKKLQDSSSERNNYISHFIEPLKVSLDKYKLDYEIKWRTKSVYSIWSKIKKQGVSFDEVYDIFAIRIIINCPLEMEKAECWKAYSAVTDIYTPSTERLRDWISNPRPNGYESLHTTVMGADAKWVEVQIRTVRMDEIAEKGFAAHWRYKGGKGESNLDKWFSDIREIIENQEVEGEELFESVKHRLYSDEIFVYTPAGDLKRLPVGSTVLDFAFDIHTNVGACTSGAKVNSGNVPLRYELKTGDKVEIITSKTRKVHQGWYKWVKTAKARNAIRRMLAEDKFRLAGNGREILERKLKHWKLNFNDEIVRVLLKHYGIKTANEFYEKIAKEEISPAQIKDLLTVDEKLDPATGHLTVADKQPVKNVFSSNTAIEISQAPENIDFSFAGCCKPIYGDAVIGFISVSGGIKIHRRYCPNALQLISKYGYRIISVNWKEENSDGAFVAQIIVQGDDRVGMLNDITKVISTELNTNMHSLEIQSKDGHFAGRISLTVPSLNKLENLLRHLLKIKGITKALRAHGSNTN